jgi:cysteine-rich repeat protein
MSTFPNPWKNRKGPWVTPAFGFSVINKEVNAAVSEAKGSLLMSTAVVTLPIYIGKIPFMSQKRSVLIQKLVPKHWDLMSASWLDAGCQVLRLNETECSLSCSNLGIFAVEYNAELFVCGDGVRDLIEGCDDWNNVNGDGCNSMCQVEDGWVCRKGNYPSETLGFDTCERIPCYAPYNCQSQGVCLSDDVCFCDSGFFGKTCGRLLPIVVQIGSNYTWHQLPLFLNAVLGNSNELLFTLIVTRGGNLTINVNGSSVAAKITVYKWELFAELNVSLNSFPSSYGLKPTSSFEFKSVFLSNIFDVRLATAGSMIVNATGRIFVALNVSLPPPFMNFSFSNTDGRTLKNSANLTIFITVCKYSVSKKLWQPMQDSIFTSTFDRQISYEFRADSPNYYALIATSRIFTIPDDAPAELSIDEPEHSNIAAIAAGIAGGVLLMAAVYVFWYMRRRNRQRVVIAAYYQATVAAARKHKFKFAADANNQESVPKPPELGDAGPRKKPHNQRATAKQPKEVFTLDQSPPPPPQGFSSDKSSVAAAIRSKFKNANRFKRSSPVINLDQDLEFELTLTQDSPSVISRNTSVDEGFEIFGDAVEVESVDSDGYGERHLDASSSCSAISMADKSESSDLEDAGIVPPLMLPLNDFEDDVDELNRYPDAGQASLKVKGAGNTRPSLSIMSSELPRNDFSTAHPSVQYDSALLQNAAGSNFGMQTSSSSNPRRNAALRSKLWKKENSTSFDA